MCSCSSHSLRGVSPYSLFYSHFNTILLFVEKSYTNPFTDVQKVTLWSLVHIKTYILNQCNTSKLRIQKNRSKTMWEKSSFWFHSLLCYCIYEKVPYTCNISTGYNTKYTIQTIYSSDCKKMFEISTNKKDRVNKCK